MFDKFNDKAMLCVIKAQKEAGLLGHSSIECEHLLLALIQVDCGCKSEFSRLNLPIKAIRNQVEDVLGKGSANPTGDFPFSDEVERILKLAVEQAARNKPKLVTPDHILISLLSNCPQRTLNMISELGASIRELELHSLKGIECHLSQAKEESTSRTFAGIRPLTEMERQRAELMLRETFLLEVEKICSYSKSRSDVFYLLVNIIGKTLRSSRALICFEQSNSVLCHEFCERKYQSCESLDWPNKNSTLLTLSMVSDSPQVIQITDCSQKEQEELRSLGVNTHLAVSLQGQDEGRSCLILHQCDQMREWPEDDLQYIQRFAQLIRFP